MAPSPSSQMRQQQQNSQHQNQQHSFNPNQNNNGPNVTNIINNNNINNFYIQPSNPPFQLPSNNNHQQQSLQHQQPSHHLQQPQNSSGKVRQTILVTILFHPQPNTRLPSPQARILQAANQQSSHYYRLQRLQIRFILRARGPQLSKDLKMVAVLRISQRRASRVMG